MPAKRIPPPIREEATGLVERFNREVLGEGDRIHYVPRFKGAYLFLDRVDWNGRKPSPICRLEWTGDMRDWKFAIYRYSKSFYDPDEWMFPGSDDVDGTVEGAMKAGLKAYEP